VTHGVKSDGFEQVLPSQVMLPFTAVGIATRKVRAEKSMLATSPWLVNMWCPQTRKLMAAIASELKAIAR
jgi:hypothetical protein